MTECSKFEVVSKSGATYTVQLETSASERDADPLAARYDVTIWDRNGCEVRRDTIPFPLERTMAHDLSGKGIDWADIIREGRCAVEEWVREHLP